MIWMSSWKTPKTMTKARPTITGLRKASGARVSAAPSTASNAPATIRTAPPSGAPRPKVSAFSRSGDSAMKIRRSGKACIARARSARRAPATPPASRLGGRERPEFSKRSPRRDRGAGAEPDCDQGCVAERDDVDDDPARVHQRQDADDRAIDGDDAEHEADAERPAKRRALATRSPVGEIACRGAHARFLAMRSPRMP